MGSCYCIAEIEERNESESSIAVHIHSELCRLVVSILFLLAGPLELRWIFAVWSVTSSMLLYFIAKTYRDIRRRQMINRWILK